MKKYIFYAPFFDIEMTFNPASALHSCKPSQTSVQFCQTECCLQGLPATAELINKCVRCMLFVWGWLCVYEKQVLTCLVVCFCCLVQVHQAWVKARAELSSTHQHMHTQTESQQNNLSRGNSGEILSHYGFWEETQQSSSAPTCIDVSVKWMCVCIQ